MRGAAGRFSRGSVPVEAALVMPVLLMFVLLAVAAGRIHTARSAVDASAREAARAASLARTHGAAQAEARNAAAGTLAQSGVLCGSRSVTADTGGLSAPLGEVGTVRVTVTCEVRLADVAVVGLPGSFTARSEFTSVVDRFRGRGE